MHSAYKFWKQTIVGHRPENPRLAKEHHENYGAEARDCAQLNRGGHPTESRVVSRHSNGIRYIQLQVRNDAGGHGRDRDVEHRAD